MDGECVEWNITLGLTCLLATGHRECSTTIADDGVLQHARDA